MSLNRKSNQSSVARNSVEQTMTVALPEDKTFDFGRTRARTLLR